MGERRERSKKTGRNTDARKVAGRKNEREKRGG
jgi:hypothetical protein